MPLFFSGKTIVKYVSLLCAALFCACASNNTNTVRSTPSETLSFVTLPKSGELHVLGVTGRQSSRTAEIEMAMEDAARKVSMYHIVWASIDAVQNIGSSFFDYYVDSKTRVEYDMRLERYMQRLKFDPDRDVSRNKDGAVFVSFTYPAAFPGNISYNYGKNPDGSPEWVHKPPREIGGFAAGIGRSGRLSKFGDTFKKSYEAAAASIVSNASTSIMTKDSSVQSQVNSQIILQSSGYLTHFLVLETWIDPETRAVYTLAIAKPVDPDVK